MRISLDLRPSLVGAHSNHTYARRSNANEQQEHKQQQQDKVTIRKPFLNGPGQKTAASALERLMEQKQNLTERRGNYLSEALKKGTSAESMKVELENIDKQIRELEEQMRKIQLEEQRKATGLDEESKKKDEKSNTSGLGGSYPNKSQEDSVVSSNTMQAVVSASQEKQNFGHIRMAQNTLRTEAKGWEHSNPARSSELKEKAENLNGKLMELSGNIASDLTKAIREDDKIASAKPAKQAKEEESSDKPQQSGSRQLTAQEIETYSEKRKGNKSPVGTIVNLTL
ncbi:hypothetical protein C8Z91_19275 [Paenibacillus elgii]|uniref:Muscle M-line assembly protein unc-89 Uncoordinated protein 89 n=1 Tax=Paenibacillus elgii TaxID=189691 RepID=A0A2T6G006_9BACL|nr:hypothetical protein [Paenibacillus elgii]PUA37489.1 hypothetical protein C8Z91_19275 [Paenibacillus elgii]